MTRPFPNVAWLINSFPVLVLLLLLFGGGSYFYGLGMQVLGETEAKYERLRGQSTMATSDVIVIVENTRWAHQRTVAGQTMMGAGMIMLVGVWALQKQRGEAQRRSEQDQ
jgi:hypothetical protein